MSREPDRALWLRGARIGTILGLALLTAGCGNDGQGDGPTEPADTPSAPADPTTTPPPDPTTGPMGEVTAEEAAELAVEDLAERVGVPAADVEVVRAVQVTWPDGALGCPQPGMTYTQALVDGTLVELSVAGERYEYHSGAGQSPFLCQDPQPPVDRAESS